MRNVHYVRALQAVLGIAVLLDTHLATAGEDKAKIEAGEKVYSTYCSPCHGDNLINSGQNFDLRRLRADQRPRFQNSVLNGKGQMPPWKGAITDEQIDQIWSYIRANAYEK